MKKNKRNYFIFRFKMYFLLRGFEDCKLEKILIIVIKFSLLIIANADAPFQKL